MGLVSLATASARHLDDDRPFAAFFPALPDSKAPGPATLGDILYADAAPAPVNESEWLEWVRAIAAGNQQALQALYRRTQRVVFTLIARITGNLETAEEVTLDVYHDVWRKAGSYDPTGGSVVGWILNQARSRAIDRLRFETRKKRTAPSDGPALQGSAAADPHQALGLAEQTGQLRKALGALTADERLAIETAYFSELTYVETAERLKLPLGTVKTRIRSGLEKLRRALQGVTGQ